MEVCDRGEGGVICGVGDCAGFADAVGNFEAVFVRGLSIASCLYLYSLAKFRLQ